MIRLFQIAAAILMYPICRWHARLFKENKKIGPAFHALWAAVYMVPVIAEAIRLKSWWLFTALTVERFVVYNPMLNKIRGLGFFYLSANSVNPSWWDKIELKWVKIYPYVWAASLLSLIVLQWLTEIV